MKKNYDVLIMGGGIMGSSIAYHLAKEGFGGKIAVLEKDPSYEFSSTCLSLAGFREQFTLEVSIKMAMYGIDKAESFDEEMAVGGEPANISFEQTGYLILANSDDELTKLKSINQLQRKLGARTEILTPEEIQRLIPEINLESITGGSFGHRDGVVDPYGFMQGYIKSAKSLGVEYVYEQVTEIERKENTLRAVKTSNGNTYEAAIIVNTAGVWGAELGKMVGIDIPIKPLRRMCYFFVTPHRFSSTFPRTINGVGASVMNEKSGGMITSRRKDDDEFGFNFKVDDNFFYDTIWPEIAERFPQLETLKLKRGWSGLYSMCIHDSNDIIGGHPELDNLFMALGFSGHGLQQSPAVGRGLAELIRLGRYETLDLTPFRIERFAENDLIPEGGIYAHSVFFNK